MHNAMALTSLVFLLDVILQSIFSKLLHKSINIINLSSLLSLLFLGGSDFYSPLMEFNKRRRKKKKKRAITGELLEINVVEQGNTLTKKFKKGEEDDAAASGGGGAGDLAAVPTEEEVDEFFAILRRMKVAVDYFDQKGKGGKDWRAVLEQVDFTVDDDSEDGGDRRDPGGDAVKNNNGREAVASEDIDLNAAAPEAADSKTWL